MMNLYPEINDIPQTLDVDSIFQKLQALKESRRGSSQGKLANPHLASCSSSNEYCDDFSTSIRQTEPQPWSSISRPVRKSRAITTGSIEKRRQRRTLRATSGSFSSSSEVSSSTQASSFTTTPPSFPSIQRHVSSPIRPTHTMSISRGTSSLICNTPSMITTDKRRYESLYSNPQHTTDQISPVHRNIPLTTARVYTTRREKMLATAERHMSSSVPEPTDQEEKESSSCRPGDELVSRISSCTLPQSEYEFRRHQAFQRQQSLQQYDVNSSSTSSQSATKEEMIEVTPGNFMRLRGSSDIWDAILNEKAVQCSCLECGIDLVTVHDADIVMCVACKSISPISEGSNGGEGGLGFSMTKEDAMYEKRLFDATKRL